MNELLTHPSVTDFAELGLTWLGNYFLHSSLLLVGALLIEKSTLLKSLIKLETLWRIALFGGVISASVAVYFAQTPAKLESTPTIQVEQVKQNIEQNRQQTSTSTIADATAQSMSTSTDSMPPLSVASSTSPQEKIQFQVSYSKMYWFNWALLLWLAWCALICSTLAIRIHAINRRVRQLTTLSVDALHYWTKDVEHLRSSTISRLNKIKTGNEWNSPFVTPNGQIYLPTWALSELTQAQRESMLAHELAHLTRRDPYWRIVSLLFTRIFFFQALNFYAHRRLTICAELECDRIAASQTQQAQALAEAIYACAKRTKTHEFNQLALAIHEDSKPNFNRVQALLHSSATVPIRKASTMENLSKTFAWTGMIALFAWSMPIMKINAETLPNLAQELQAITSIAENSPLLKHANIEASSVAPVTPNTSNPVALSVNELKTSELKESELTATPSDLRNEKIEVAKPLLEQIKIPTRLNTETEITQASPTSSDLNKLEQGIAAFKQSDFETARAMLGKLAEQHHPEAQALYAEMLWNGWGGESNAVLAERYFRQAAAMGNERAINFLPILNNRLIHSNAITRLTTSIEVTPYTDHLSICKKHADVVLSILSEQISPASIPTPQYQQKYLKMVFEKNTHARCYQQYLVNINNDLAMAKIFPSELHASMTPAEVKRASLNLKQTYQALKTDAESHLKEFEIQFNKLDQIHRIYSLSHQNRSKNDFLEKLHPRNETSEEFEHRNSRKNTTRLHERFQ